MFFCDFYFSIIKFQHNVLLMITIVLWYDRQLSLATPFRIGWADPTLGVEKGNGDGGSDSGSGREAMETQSWHCFVILNPGKNYS